MKFVHIADMHFDTEFESIAQINNLSEIRRLEQRKILKKVIEYCKDNNTELLLISGDLYEQKYIRKSTIKYINDLFNEIPDTKIFISPGNHDPYIKNSYYNTYEWNKNVYIFKDEIEKIKLDENTNIYGYGFTDFYCKNSGIEEIILDEKNKINILITHGSLDGGNDDYKQYNPISNSKLRNIGFDYIALGHIHKRYDNENKTNRIVYPGSPISMGFDELGEHGMIIGEINKGRTDIEFIKLDEREYKEIEIDITDFTSKEEIIEKINSLELEEKNLYKIILNGFRNIEINLREIISLVEHENIVKIKDKTQISFDIESIKNQNDIKGIFIKRILERAEEEALSKEELEKAIELGISSLN